MAKFEPSAALISQMRDLYAGGLSIKEVAASVGLGATTTRRILAEAGVTFRVPNARFVPPTNPRPTTQAAEVLRRDLTAEQRARAQHATRKAVR